MNWQEELANKAKELNLKGGELNDRTSSRSSNRNDNRSSRDTSNSIHAKNRKDLNNNAGKEEKIMITREAALDDLEKLEKEVSSEDSKVIVKVAKIIVKILATIRSNQLLTDDDKVRIKAAREARKTVKTEEEQ